MNAQWVYVADRWVNLACVASIETHGAQQGAVLIFQHNSPLAISDDDLRVIEDVLHDEQALPVRLVTA